MKMVLEGYDFTITITDTEVTVTDDYLGDEYSLYGEDADDFLGALDAANDGNSETFDDVCLRFQEYVR